MQFTYSIRHVILLVAYVMICYAYIFIFQHLRRQGGEKARRAWFFALVPVGLGFVIWDAVTH